MIVQNLEAIARGEDVVVTMTMTPTTDITGWTLVMTLKQQPTDAAALATINGVLTTPAAGISTYTINAATTAPLPPGEIVYDIWRTDNGAATRLTQGTIPVQGSIRRS